MELRQRSHLADNRFHLAIPHDFFALLVIL